MEIVWSYLATEGLLSILEYVETTFGSRVSQRVYTELTGYIETLANSNQSPEHIRKVIADYLRSYK